MVTLCLRFQVGWDGIRCEWRYAIRRSERMMTYLCVCVLVCLLICFCYTCCYWFLSLPVIGPFVMTSELYIMCDCITMKYRTQFMFLLTEWYLIIKYFTSWKWKCRENRMLVCVGVFVWACLGKCARVGWTWWVQVLRLVQIGPRQICPDTRNIFVESLLSYSLEGDISESNRITPYYGSPTAVVSQLLQSHLLYICIPGKLDNVIHVFWRLEPAIVILIIVIVINFVIDAGTRTHARTQAHVY